MPRASRPTRAKIALRALLHNLRYVRKLVGPSTIIMPVVKANAYGHGIAEVASFLEATGFSNFGVATAEEGALLRAAGITSAIHVFTLSTAAQAELIVRYRLEPTVATPDSVRTLRTVAERARRPVDVHLKIETGMNRIGVRPEELRGTVGALGRSRRLHVKGVYTHLATSDEPRSRFVGRQQRVFEAALEELSRLGVRPGVVHAANSGAILRHPELHYDMVRPGIMMYGYSPAGERDHREDLRPAMRFQSAVSQVKDIRKGESVSYGRIFRAKRTTRVATIPVGYADGLFRSLSNNGYVLVKGSRRPIVGRVCMDQTMIDCTGLDVRVGDEVVIFGTQGDRFLSAWEQALRVRSIPYELTCAVSARVPREYNT